MITLANVDPIKLVFKSAMAGFINRLPLTNKSVSLYQQSQHCPASPLVKYQERKHGKVEKRKRKGTGKEMGGTEWDRGRERERMLLL